MRCQCSKLAGRWPRIEIRSKARARRAARGRSTRRRRDPGAASTGAPGWSGEVAELKTDARGPVLRPVARAPDRRSAVGRQPRAVPDRGDPVGVPGDLQRLPGAGEGRARRVPRPRGDVLAHGRQAAVRPVGARDARSGPSPACSRRSSAATPTSASSPSRTRPRAAIIHTFDTFLEQRLKISAEIALEIHMCLLARAGVELTEIERVYSIPVAAGQCRRWLATQPAARHAWSSRARPPTARAWRTTTRAAPRWRPRSRRGSTTWWSCAATSRTCSHNMTRFLVRRARAGRADRARQDVAAAGDARRAGDPVPRAGRVRRARPQHEQDREPPVAAAALGVRLLRRHRRPRTRRSRWRPRSPMCAQSCETLKVLGSYPRADAPRPSAPSAPTTCATGTAARRASQAREGARRPAGFAQRIS